MNKLIITANPSTKWFTHAIANKFKELSVNNWDNVEILDLYKTNLKQEFLTFEDLNEKWIDETTKKLQEKITWADELVFVFPIWWWDMPAIMKNFYDSNFTAWFAFKYENWKPVWLLKWKTARIIATSWAPSFFYKIILHIQFFWNMNRIWFCWLKQKSFTVFWDIDSDKIDKNKYLNELDKLV